MSSRSIGSKLQGLEERLRSETSAPPRRPHLNIGASIPVVQVSQASIETEAKLREIHSMSGILTINNKRYRTDKDDLQHRGELGNGTSGHVVEMLHIPSGAVIAVKQMRRSGNFEENKRILMDLEVVLRSQCPYIVGCLGYFITAADVWICMELMASCFDKILKKLGGPIPEDILGKVTVATVNALSYLKEEHGVIHRDVKPSNILVDERGVVKLCDFGISGRLVDSKAKTRSAGCAAYMAPERIDPPDPQRPDYDIRADVWSLGITLVELATGKFPYRDCQNDFEVLSRVIEEEPPELPDSSIFSEEFKSFVHQCLIKDYRLRPKYAALLEHPFVRRAAESNASVGNWLASALPAGSLRLTATTPVFHHKIRTGNSGEQNITKDHPSPQSSQHNGLNSFSFSLDHNASSRTAVTNATSVTPVKEENVHSSSINNAEKLINTSKPCEQSDQSSSDNEMLSIVVISTANNLTVDKKEPLSCVSSLEEPSTSINNISVESNPSNLNDLNKKLSENLAISKNIPEKRSSNIYSPPVERNNMVTPDKVNLISGSRNTHVNKNHIQAQQLNVDGSPEYDLNSPHRIRSLSNTMLCGSNATSERWPPPKLISSSPNTKKYFANIDIRNQPFSGGGGPSSFENYANQNRRQELMQSEYRSYGSPEVNRKQYFSPSRNKKSSSFEHANQGMESPRNIASPTNFIVSKIDLFENEPSPPCFKPNEPTNYFTSTSVCTMSRYSGTPAIRNRNGIIYAGSYHQNPGGSCSQPASLEAYGDTRHTPHGYSRVPEKSFSPPLWSPQPAPRRAGRERDDRDRDTWRTSDTSHHQQISTPSPSKPNGAQSPDRHNDSPGNTSPIVLQRFYHQQGQRRSRRDWDSNPRQSSSSLSRETSVGRSPEPPRRANRDPSQSREHAPQIEHPLLREWRERDRTPSQHRVPSRNESTAGILDNDRQSEYRSHQMNEGERSPLCFSPTARRDREQIVNEANAQFESKMKKSTYHHHMREKDTRDELNGDCYKMSRIESCKKDIPISSEQIRIENKSSKEKCKDKVKKNDCSTQQSHRDENIQYSPVMLPKHVRNHGKEKDDQGSSRSSSPSAAGGSMKGSRLTPLPRRIATSEYDDIAKRMQDSPHNFVPGLRNSGGPPQPPPRRTTDSWSLPASPLPTRPI